MICRESSNAIQVATKRMNSAMASDEQQIQRADVFLLRGQLAVFEHVAIDFALPCALHVGGGANG